MRGWVVWVARGAKCLEALFVEQTKELQAHYPEKESRRKQTGSNRYAGNRTRIPLAWDPNSWASHGGYRVERRNPVFTAAKFSKERRGENGVSWNPNHGRNSGVCFKPLSQRIHRSVLDSNQRVLIGQAKELTPYCRAKF
jgi:hypothetical protein